MPHSSDQKKPLNIYIAAFALSMIILHVLLKYQFKLADNYFNTPLFLTLLLGGSPLLWELAKKALNKEFGSDLLAAISIISAVFLGEYLAGALVVLMLSGGEAIESYAMDNASSILKALAKRMPSVAHIKVGTKIEDIAIEKIQAGDQLVIYPHEVCPVDGVVSEGHGYMDEAYLTGEPYKITKTTGSAVISGSINGEAAMTIQASKKASDSRYAKIVEVMHDSEQNKPQIRRLGDQLGAFYTPLALAIAIIAWIVSGNPSRFLSVLVIATPCPLLIGIPVAIIGAISLAAKRAIIVKAPSALEQISKCKTAIFDKTGTLTYGEAKLTEIILAENVTEKDVLTLVASLERYSKHPLASAIIKLAEEKKLTLLSSKEVHEVAGKGLVGVVQDHSIRVTSRTKLSAQGFSELHKLEKVQSGLECIILIDEKYAATFRFVDAARSESKPLLSHLKPQHNYEKIMILSGDRASEVNNFASSIGVTEVYSEKSPEEKLEIVRAETKLAKTLYVGDGINDAPAMMSATVGLAIGQNSDITSEAAGIVILDNNLDKVDEAIHIGQHMKKIALQSAIGGMLLSIVGMIVASMGYLSPVEGAISQEVIDVLAVLNALRVSIAPQILSDFKS